MDGAAATEREAYARMQRRAEGICSLIVASDYPAIDLAIRIRNLRDYAEQHFPERLDLFDRIYGSRFRRLYEQFRPDEAGELPQW